jgi:hypothetical protein
MAYVFSVAVVVVIMVVVVCGNEIQSRFDLILLFFSFFLSFLFLTFGVKSKKESLLTTTQKECE